MSSPVSLPLPPASDGSAAFGAALMQVAENSLFAYAEPCDGDRFAAAIADRRPQEGWLVASVAFAGPFMGTASISLPGTLALELCGAFSGLQAEEISERQMVDFAGELANMACGLWLTHSHRLERFDLSAPRVAQSTCSACASAPDGVRSAAILLNDVPVRVSLHASEGGD